jgi:hypothetical protein
MQFYTILYLRYFSIDWCKKIIFFKSFLQREFNNKTFSNVPRTEALVLVDTNASFLYFNLPFNAEQMIALHNNYLWNIALVELRSIKHDDIELRFIKHDYIELRSVKHDDDIELRSIKHTNFLNFIWSKLVST